MAKSKGTGRGWHGDSEGHSRAGRKGGRATGRNRKNREKSGMSEDTGMEEVDITREEDIY